MMILAVTMSKVKFAAETKVPISKSRAEIEDLLAKYGADQFISGYDKNRAMIGFAVEGRQVRLTMYEPDPADHEHNASGYLMGKDQARRAYEKERRRRWRCLLLCLKAKLEAVSTGIATFEQEFLAYVVTPNGGTVYDDVGPKLAAAYETGNMPRLLPGAS